MSSEYLAIFEKRGRSYDQAMQTYPAARDAEFQRLLELVDTQQCRSVLDVPSGGGYLQKFFPPQTSIDSIEPCRDFAPQSAHLNSSVDLDALNLPPGNYQLIVCLAALHHVDDKQGFFQQCRDALHDDGHFCVGDIAHGHSIGRFLDDFAGQHNGTGHHGRYLSPAQVHSLAAAAGLRVIACEEKPCPWVFRDTAQLLHFCRLLFGLQQVSDSELHDALQHYIGIDHDADQVRLRWQMLYATLLKPGSEHSFR